MLRGATAKMILAVMVVGLLAPRADAADMQAGKAMGKLGRGCVNLLTGWVEVPKRISETAQDQGTAAGLTWGLLRGIGYGFVRTAAGVYEIVTFPVAAPPDYAPVIDPEYIFSESRESTASSSY